MPGSTIYVCDSCMTRVQSTIIFIHLHNYAMTLAAIIYNLRECAQLSASTDNVLAAASFVTSHLVLAADFPESIHLFVVVSILFPTLLIVLE